MCKVKLSILLKTDSIFHRHISGIPVYYHGTTTTDTQRLLSAQLCTPCTTVTRLVITLFVLTSTHMQLANEQLLALVCGLQQHEIRVPKISNEIASRHNQITWQEIHA